MCKVLISGLTALLVMSVTQSSSAQFKQNVYTTKKITGPPPAIDARFDDSVWANSTWDKAFKSANGSQTPQETSISIAYDETNLYIAIRLLDTEPDKIKKIPGKKDDTEGDRIALFLDTNLDKKTSHVFVVNAAGTQRDQYTWDGGKEWDNGWEADWHSVVKVTDAGWFAEIQIPFNQLDLPDTDEHVWGLQFTRAIAREKAPLLWSLFDAKAGFIGNFGELRGIKGIGPGGK